jgi:hypothetical protein
MSAPRQGFRLLALGLALGLAMLGGTPVWSSLSAPIVTDPHTGLAIDGFDPVAYFTGEGATQGMVNLEYQLADVTWRFRSEGNRAAFIDHPEVYAPQFGGYDPVAIARGVPVAGHPLIWIIVEQRLYFFYDNKARAEFIESPVSAIIAARQRWPQVSRTLP